MLGALNELVEQRILEAMRKGEFDRLPGEGRPLELEDDALVPEDLRVAHRILKNAGFLPPEVQALRDVRDLIAQAITEASAVPAERRASRRLLALTLALERQGLTLTTPAALGYHQVLVDRFAGR
jgi:hypothetical protein